MQILLIDFYYLYIIAKQGIGQNMSYIIRKSTEKDKLAVLTLVRRGYMDKLAFKK